ncbi:BCCT transporter [Halobacteriales archaeon QS_8_69_26]|nr:MAG: BCCT transporter [Halobacteriales archaeon QS_8_69_26]
MIDKPDGANERIDGIVGGVGVCVAAVFVLAMIVAGDWVSGVASDVNQFLWKEVGMLYLSVVFLFVVFVAWLLVGPWGSVQLGDGDPEFSYPVYFAMLFSAGIAAGIVFWGPAEAIFHFEFVPPYVGAEAQSSAAALGAIQYTMFHWGFSAWTAYAVIGIPIAYYAYNFDAPLRVSTLLAPVVGLDDLDGGLSKLVDVLAVFATLGGLTTTLGLISRQFLEGTAYQFGAETSVIGTVAVIGGFTLIFTVSVVTGVNRGIRRIAIVNVVLFGALALAVFLLGPTMRILTGTAEGFGYYLVEFPMMSLYNGETGSLVGAGDWVGGTWTVFYWAWWLSWAPFVGLFIARISRGRSIREVVVTGVVAPALATMAWFGIMGNTSIHLQQTGGADILGVLGQEGTTEAVAAFPLFEALPFGSLLMLAFLGTVITWLVTSADTAVLSLSMLTTYGTTEPAPRVRVLWGVLVGVIAAVVLTLGGAEALQEAAIITGGPFAVIAVVSILGMILEFTGQRRISVAEQPPDDGAGAPDEAAGGTVEEP